jgi:hypothetical protein
MADLFRAPPLLKQTADELAQHVIIHDLAATWPGPTIYRQLLRHERPILPALGIPVAAQLPADRRRTPADLGSDRPDRVPLSAQVGDSDPLVLRQIPLRDLDLSGGDHWRIVQPATVCSDDRAAVSPTLPRPNVDPHDPARLRIGDAPPD